jgi:hypothetical protein
LRRSLLCILLFTEKCLLSSPCIVSKKGGHWELTPFFFFRRATSVSVNLDGHHVYQMMR